MKSGSEWNLTTPDILPVKNSVEFPSMQDITPTSVSWAYRFSFFSVAIPSQTKKKVSLQFIAIKSFGSLTIWEIGCSNPSKVLNIIPVEMSHITIV